MSFSSFKHRAGPRPSPQTYGPIVSAFTNILGSKPRPQIGLASLCRPTAAPCTAAANTAAEPTAAARTAAARTAAEPTAAARTAAARTAVAPDEIRRERRRWLPVGSLAVALDRARQSIAVPRNSPVANIARPRVDDVGSGVHCLGVAGPHGD